MFGRQFKVDAVRLPKDAQTRATLTKAKDTFERRNLRDVVDVGVERDCRPIHAGPKSSGQDRCESPDWFYDVDEWILFAVRVVAFLVPPALGERIGYRFREQESERALSVITSTQAATLGTFAILIGFSSSMAINLFEKQRTLLLDEADAVGTTELRARMLLSLMRQKHTASCATMRIPVCRSIAIQETTVSSIRPSRPGLGCMRACGDRQRRRARCNRFRCQSGFTCSLSTR